MKVPVNYRQSFKWYANLDATSLLFVAGGGVVAFRLLTAPMATGLKLVAMAGSASVGALLGLGRWPLEQGDGAVTWGRRALEYRSRPRQAGLIRALSVGEAIRRQQTHDTELREEPGRVDR